MSFSASFVRIDRFLTSRVRLDVALFIGLLVICGLKVHSDISALRDRVALLSVEAEKRQAELEASERLLATYSARIGVLESTAKRGVFLARPSRTELAEFLAKDLTDQRTYRTGYVCMHFASDLKHNAALAGWNLSVVLVNFQFREFNGFVQVNGHVLNGVYLADGSFVYIEPQTDKIFSSLLEHLKVFLNEPQIKILEVAIVW